MVSCSTLLSVITLAFVWHNEKVCSALLYPQESETREKIILNGIWNFRFSPVDNGFPLPAWYKKDLSETGPVIRMPVPASYNDITQNADIRDHVGVVWYDRRFYVPHRWKAEFRVWLRFSSVHYSAMVWVNTKFVMCHNIAHLPFEHDVTNLLNFDGDNLLTVACNNTLTKDTIPEGELTRIYRRNETRYQQKHSFRFFNYAGIHRSVFLYTTPYTYINKIKVNTEINNNSTGIVVYAISYRQYQFGNDIPDEEVDCVIKLLDCNKSAVAIQHGCTGTMKVANAHFWWPHLMSKETGYLYTFQVFLSTDSKHKLDVYRQKIGIRTVKVKNTIVLINNVKMYMRGINLYEDSEMRGQGSDLSVIVKNLNAIRWIGANTILTAHYPHTEQTYQLADELGIMIVDQYPCANTRTYIEPVLGNNQRSLTKLIDRDENHPSVIMWSIAHMPYTASHASARYLGELAKHVKSLDPTRPITLSLNTPSNVDRAAQYVDVIGIRPPSLYNNVIQQVVDTLTRWQGKHKKPVVVSEYGAQSIFNHLYLEYGWSVDRQVKLMSQYFRAFDLLRREGLLVGEFFINLADFKAAQPDSQYSAPEVHETGILTRARQPRASAHHLRRRYHLLAKLSYSPDIPDHFYNYVMDSNQKDPPSKYENPDWLVLGMRNYTEEKIVTKIRKTILIVP